MGEQMADSTKQLTLDEIHEWVFDGLGFCGCGDPEAALEFLKSVLLAIRQRSNGNEIEEGDKASQERWSRNSDAIRQMLHMETAPAMAWSYLYMLDSKGLLEHGGNCSGSWLTERGEQILDALLKYDIEDIIEGVEDDILDAAVIEA